MIPAVACRRGMTLAELMVTLALVVVMIAMAVSFVMMMSGQTKASEENLVFQQDLSMVKSVVEGWMTTATAEELDLLDADVTGVDKPLKLQNGSFRTNKGATIQVSSISAVSFDIVEDNGDYLLFCTVYRADSEEHYTFCVNPREGETVGAG